MSNPTNKSILSSLKIHTIFRCLWAATSTSRWSCHQRGSSPHRQRWPAPLISLSKTVFTKKKHFLLTFNTGRRHLWAERRDFWFPPCWCLWFPVFSKGDQWGHPWGWYLWWSHTSYVTIPCRWRTALRPWIAWHPWILEGSQMQEKMLKDFKLKTKISVEEGSNTQGWSQLTVTLMKKTLSRTTAMRISRRLGGNCFMYLFPNHGFIEQLLAR